MWEQDIRDDDQLLSDMNTTFALVFGVVIPRGLPSFARATCQRRTI